MLRGLHRLPAVAAAARPRPFGALVTAFAAALAPIGLAPIGLALVGLAPIGLALTGCSQLPPRAFLRYEPTEVRDWQREGDGMLVTTALGARFVVDLQSRDTRIQMTCENGSSDDLQVAFGPESTRGLSAAIGEMRQRPMDRDRVEGVPDFAPYRSLEPVDVPAAWRAEFYLDSPLGREPTVGQYIVVVLEVRRGLELERRLLPLVASNTSPQR